MTDLFLDVQISRAALNLPWLLLNDHANYYVGPTLFGGQVQWNKTQVSSPFVDGATTTFRSRQMVSEQVIIEVLGADPADLRVNLDALLTAFSQDNFEIYMSIGGAHYRYRCEASDYQVAWTGPRAHASQLQVTFTVPRQPVPVYGVA